MDFSVPGAGQDTTRRRVSVITRLAAVVAYAIPAIGGALSSLLLTRELQSIKSAEVVGIEAVMAAVKGSALPVTISIYLAALAGFIVIVILIVRALTETKTASPPIWFFALCALLCLVPAALFWRAEWLVIQGISPGGSISAGGIGAVGEQIAILLLISIVSAPVVFLIYLIMFAVPFKSGPKSTWTSIIGAVVIEALLIAAFAVPFLIGEPQKRKELAALPDSVKSADSDADIQKDTSVILILAADGKIFVEQTRQNEKAEVPVKKEELPDRLKQLMEDKTPDKRIVYLKADVNAAYENVLQIFDIIRKTDVDKAGLVAYATPDPKEPYDVYPRRFEVKLPEIKSQIEAPVKPNPLMLVAVLNKDGKISLNREELGTISDPKKMITLLTRVFTERENNGIFREGTNEVEKTVLIRVDGASKYGDFIKLIDAVKIGGGQPIVIQTDDSDPERIVLE